MSKMLKDAIAAANQQGAGGLQKAGDANIDPAAPPSASPAGKKVARSSVRSKKAGEERVPFGSYLSRDLHRAFKVACVAEGIEMRDGLEQAIADWVAKHKPGL
ncbi:hypothetical protein ABZW10_36410 [Kitasatospora sp. NPDC004723]|uniref:hypothetical protein n=1 Tax=Kitasatospora sp. NPDC004723 TaxID=3154288 RepID=UPI0033A9BEB1